MERIAELIARYAKTGSLQAICVRPERRITVEKVTSAVVTATGLVSDHGKSAGKRAVTLVQFEHLSVIASFLGVEKVMPEVLRRNLVISGINLLGLKNRKFQIGGVILQGTGICAPCSRMEEAFGMGGYSAVRGHGGNTASVLQEGTIAIGDDVCPL